MLQNHRVYLDPKIAVKVPGLPAEKTWLNVFLLLASLYLFHRIYLDHSTIKNFDLYSNFNFSFNSLCPFINVSTNINVFKTN